MSDAQSGDERIDELLALAALGETTEAEDRELDAALEADAILRAELDADLEVAARIQAVNVEVPSAELKDRVMTAIDEAPAPRFAAPALDGVVDLAHERGRRRARWMPAAAAAAIALIAVAGVVLINDGAANDDVADDVVAEVIDASDASNWQFDGDLVAGGGSGSLRAVYSADADALVLEGVGIDPLSDAETYQLWLVDATDDRVESVGVFRPDDDGRVLLAFEGADPDESMLGITVEPAGGSEQPTLPIVATAETTA